MTITLPMAKQHRRRLELAGGRLVELDLRWATTRAWRRSPEAASGEWFVWPIGGAFVAAFRLIG